MQSGFSGISTGASEGYVVAVTDALQEVRTVVVVSEVVRPSVEIIGA